jgi:lysophospholipase L1-like esterase
MNRILATSLLLNVLLVLAIVGFASFTGFFVQSNVLDPLYEREVSVFEAFPVESGDVVFLGDTLVAAAPLDEMFPGVPVRNRGIVGDTSAGILDRLDQVIAGEPGAIVLMVGTFDVLAGIPRRDTIARVEQILDGFGESHPGVPVMLLSVLPRDVEAVQSVQRLNAGYAELAAARGLGWLDLAEAFKGADGAIDPTYSNDGMHLNGPAYAHWRDALAPWLAEVTAAAPLAVPDAAP